MSISIECPGCQRNYTLADDKAGKKVRCKCSQVLLVPQPSVAGPLPPPIPAEVPAAIAPPAYGQAAEGYAYNNQGPAHSGQGYTHNHGNSNPSYGYPNPGYVHNDPGYVHNSPGYGQSNQGYGQTMPSYGPPAGSYVGTTSYGDPPPYVMPTTDGMASGGASALIRQRKSPVLAYSLIGGGVLALIVVVVVIVSLSGRSSLHDNACLALMMPTVQQQLQLSPSQEQQLRPIMSAYQQDLASNMMQIVASMAPMMQNQTNGTPDLRQMQQGVMDAQNQAVDILREVNGRYVHRIEKILTAEQIRKLNEIASQLPTNSWGPYGTIPSNPFGRMPTGPFGPRMGF